MDKYDKAIEYLRELDAGQGSYLDEVACLIEELLGRVHELESAQAPVPPPTQWEIERNARMGGFGKQLAARQRAWFESQRSGSAARDDAE
jgi:hypothetical protein